MTELLLAVLMTAQFGLVTVMDTDIMIELYAMNCQKVAEFTAVTVVIPEDHYILYQTSRDSLPNRVWKLDGIKEVRISYKENQWLFVRGMDGKLQEVEQPECWQAI